jgi:hypothetical protein
VADQACLQLMEVECGGRARHCPGGKEHCHLKL